VTINTYQLINQVSAVGYYS